MVKRSKNFNKAKEMVEKDEYSLEEAVSLIKKMSFVKFDESLDISLNLGIDPKHSDQMVRGTIVLPHGTGKTKRVCVIASGEKVTEAGGVTDKNGQTTGVGHVVHILVVESAPPHDLKVERFGIGGLMPSPLQPFACPL